MGEIKMPDEQMEKFLKGIADMAEIERKLTLITGWLIGKGLWKECYEDLKLGTLAEDGSPK